MCIHADTLYLDMDGEFSLDFYLWKSEDLLELSVASGPSCGYDFASGVTFSWNSSESRWEYSEGVLENPYHWPSWWGEGERNRLLELAQKIQPPFRIRRSHALQEIVNGLVEKAEKLWDENLDKADEDGYIDPDYAFDASGEVSDPEDAVAWVLISMVERAGE